MGPLYLGRAIRLLGKGWVNGVPSPCQPQRYVQPALHDGALLTLHSAVVENAQCHCQECTVPCSYSADKRQHAASFPPVAVSLRRSKACNAMQGTYSSSTCGHICRSATCRSECPQS